VKDIYIFSGLGADKRMFDFIGLSGFNVTFIEWIKPLTDEPIEKYVLRIIEQIKTPDPILIGLSFGGIMAMETAKVISTSKVILLASAKTGDGIPCYYKCMVRLRLHKLLPAIFFLRPFFLTYWLFGTETDKDKKLLKNILQDTDSDFLLWAIDRIGYWNNTTVPENTVLIHGTKDRILPSKWVNPDIKVVGGGHFMTVNQAQLLTEIIRKEID